MSNWHFFLLTFAKKLLPKGRLMALFPAVYSIQDGVTSILVLDLSIRRQIFLLLLRCKGGLLSCRLQNSSYPDGERQLHRSRERWKGQRLSSICYSFTNSSSAYQTQKVVKRAIPRTCKNLLEINISFET